MKLIISFFLFTFLIFPQNGWLWQNPTPQGVTLNDITFISTEIGWAVGNDGTVIKTTDTGATWLSVLLQVNDFPNFHISLYGVAFTDQNNGVAVGFDGFNHGAVIIRTTDAGLTWSENSSLRSINLNSVAFADFNNGIAVGDGIVRTTNGGVTWNYQENPFLHSITYIDSLIWIAVGEGGTILRSTNGGLDWKSETNLSMNDLNSVFFINEKKGTAVGSGGTILRTSDGGLTWFSQSGGTSLKLNDVFFKDENNGTIIGENGLLLTTTNGGNLWEIQQPKTSQDLNAVAGSGNSIAAVGNYGTTIKSSDGGTTWRSLSKLVITEGLVAASFTDENTGTVVGYEGTILRTTNGGSTWNLQQSGTSYYLYEVSFADKDLGIAAGNNFYQIGDSSVILRTTDGGKTWNKKFYYKWGLTQIQLINKDIGYATGYASNGDIATQLILKTTDGGITWNSPYDKAIPSLGSMSFVDVNTGYISSGEGYLLKTTDGGSSWMELSAPASFIFDISFIDANTGTLVGRDGIVYRTIDGGITFNSQYSGTDQTLSAVSFTDINNGIACGDYNSDNPPELAYAVIIRTTNGGETWKPEFRFGGRFNDAVFINNSAFVVGWDGAILKKGDIIVPVELTSFTAVKENKRVLLNWQTATETNNKGFEVQRKSSNTDFKVLSFISGNGTSAKPKNYSYSDELFTSGTYTYRLKQIDFNGKFSYSKEVEAGFNNVSEKFALEQNYPNPFNPTTKIKFSLPVQQMVELKVFDILGNEVAVLIRENLPAGNYEKVWDGSSHASGVYYYRIISGEYQQIKKMVLIK